jgi:hypothetical protein
MNTAASPTMTPQNAPIRYDGSACLNVRSVVSACELLRTGAKSQEPLDWKELSNALWFVETSVTSKSLFFDGTVPKSTTDQAIDAIGQLTKDHQLNGFGVSPISFETPQEILDAARDAFGESHLLINNFKIDPADKPLAQAEHDQFVSEMRKVRTLPEAARDAIALQWVSEAFRGSKCLAAMVANGEHTLTRAQEIYNQHPANQGPLVTAAFINRFRLNYVNQLASRRSSAYVPDPSFETITQEHVRLFKDFLLDRVVKNTELPPNAENILLENMRSETPLPPIGLYALMATSAKKQPGAILETAYNQFRQDDGLMKLLWKNTRGGIALKKSNNVENAAEIDQYFYERYKIIEKQSQGIKPPESHLRRSRAYLIPAFLKGLAKAVPEALGFGKIADAVWTVLREAGIEASVPFLSDRLMGEGCDSYISQYKNLKWEFQKDDSVRVPLAKLSERVEQVFGRPLAQST